MTGQRRLADDGVPRRPTAGRSSAAPTSRPTTARACPASCGSWTRSTTSGATGATSSREQADQLRQAIEREHRAPAGRRPGGALLRRRPRPGGRRPARAVRRRVRRLRPRAEVPAGDDASTFLLAPGARSHRRPRRLDDGHRHRSTRWPRAASTTTSAAASPATRSTRTGSCPTSRRCSTTRRCSSGAYLHGWLVTGDAALPPGRRGDDRLRPARPAPPRRRLLLRRGRRLRGRRGQVLRLVARGARRRSAATTLPEVIRVLRRHRARQLRGSAHRLLAATSSTLVDRTEDPSRRGRPRRSPRSSPRREQRVRPGLDDKVLLGWNALFLALAGRGGRRARPRRLDGRGARQRPLPRSRAAARRRPAAAVVAGRAAADTSPTPRTTPRCSRRCVTLAEVDDVAWLERRRGASPTSWSALFARRASAAGSSPPAPTPRRSSSGPRTSWTTPRRRRTRSPPTGCSGWPRSPATPTRPHAPSAGSRRWRRWPGEHPTAFAFLLEALERLVRPPIEVAVVGEPDDPARGALVDVLRRRLLPASVGSPPHPVPAPSSRRSSPSGPRVDGRATAYVCERFACRLPVTDADALRAQIDDVSTTRR